jgi:excisionase family DNA binding protein
VIDLEAEIERVVRRVLAETAPANDTHLTVAEYARRWSLSTSTVRIAIREKRLPCVRVGRAVRVPSEAKIARPVKTTAARADAKLLGKR